MAKFNRLIEKTEIGLYSATIVGRAHWYTVELRGCLGDRVLSRYTTTSLIDARVEAADMLAEANRVRAEVTFGQEA